MPEAPTQDGKPGILTTPLGKDKLLLERFESVEGLSELFEFRIEALSTDQNVNFDNAIGKQCTVKIKTYKDEEREFHGILAEAHYLGGRDHLASYRLTLRPWLWLLSHTTDYRIFENKKVPDIIEEVFRDRGFAGEFLSEIRDRGSFPTREYCVQYRESDFHFVSRLMEEEGIYYFFKHQGGKHVMVLANQKSSHQPVPNHATIPFLPPAGSFHPAEQRIEHWTSERRFRTGKFALNDYNYEKPNQAMLSEAQGSAKYAHADLEVYHYPGNYKDKSAGERYAKIQLEAEQALDYRRQGSGNAISLFPGGLTKLEKHPVGDYNVEYLIVRTMHSFFDQSYRSGTDGGVDTSSHFEFLPSDKPYRAPIITPKPRIYGIQTAKVVTKDEGGSEEIEVEKLSEIYVWFYWDRKRHKEKRSCKIRVAQVWASKQWGGQFIPRVGMEAVIEFLEGDPDRPICVGAVYNENNQPPYPLPSKKNIAGIKSDSTKGGGGYNELYFDDTKSAEKINVHAQKDMDVLVLNDETRETRHDLNTTVLHKEVRTIGANFEVPVGAASRDTILKKGDDKLSIDSGDQNVKIAMNQKIEAGMTIKEKANMQIELTCGASKITMTPASIKLDSPMITINGLAITTIKGGIVMIN